MQAFLLDNLFWLVLAAASASGLMWSFARSGKQALSSQAAILAVSRENGLFIDVRPASNYADGHIVNAHNIPASELDKKLDALAKYKKKPVVIVCQNGMRGRPALQQLEKAGFEKAYTLAGGMVGWRDAQLPLSTKPTKHKF